MCSVHHNSKINEGYFLKCFKKHKYISTESVVFFYVVLFSSTTSFVLLVTSWPVLNESTSRPVRRHVAHARVQSAFFHKALLRAVQRSSYL